MEHRVWHRAPPPSCQTPFPSPARSRRQRSHDGYFARDRRCSIRNSSAVPKIGRRSSSRDGSPGSERPALAPGSPTSTARAGADAINEVSLEGGSRPNGGVARSDPASYPSARTDLNVWTDAGTGFDHRRGPDVSRRYELRAVGHVRARIDTSDRTWCVGKLDLAFEHRPNPREIALRCRVLPPVALEPMHPWAAAFVEQASIGRPHD